MTYNPIEVESYLSGLEYPRTKYELIQAARENGAPEDVLKTLSRLRRDHFEKPMDVVTAMTDIREELEHEPVFQ